MKRQGTEQELAVIEWQKVTSIAWPTLLIVSVAQSLLSESPVQSWQILFITSNIVTLTLSYFLHYRYGIKFAFTPTFLSLLITPIMIGNQPRQPWVSLGLIILAAAIYFSAIERLWLAILVVIILCITQNFLAAMNIKSFSDNQDLTLLFGYFSFLWTFVIGIASVFIHRNYLKVADSVEETVSQHLDSSLRSLRQSSQINESQKSNLKLHGTFLNSLIFLRNSLETENDVTKTKKLLKSEFEDLVSTKDFVYSSDLKHELEELVRKRTLNRITVEIIPFSIPVLPSKMQSTCLEIVREILLNFEKHTGAMWFSINVALLKTGTFEIVLKNDVPKQVSKEKKRETVALVLKSVSLQKIITSTKASVQSTLSRDREQNIIVVKVSEVDEKKSLRDALENLRNLGLNDFAFNYIRASSLVAALSLPGYFFLRLDPLVLITTTLLTLAMFLALVDDRRFSSNLVLGFLSVVLLPVIALSEEECSQIASMPWLFNLVLTVCFFFAINQRYSVVRFVPLFCLSIQSLLVPFILPDACRSVLLGSIPGIPLIMVLAFIVLRVRKRQLRDDKFSIFSVEENDNRFTSISISQSKYYESLLREIKLFIDSFDTSSADLKERIEALILKIQNYLTCSPYFDSWFILRLYHYFELRYSRGFTGRFIILGDFSDFQDDKIEWSVLVTKLDSILNNGTFDTSLLRTHELEFVFDSRFPTQLDSSLLTAIPGVSFHTSGKLFKP